MRLLAKFLLLIFIPNFGFSQIKTTAFSDLESLQKAQQKPVVIHLYTDWCSICKIESFTLNKNRELVNMISENFYFINLEAEKTKETINFQGKQFNYLSNGNSGIHELALALFKNKNQPVYPLWIILDKNQNLIYYHEGKFHPEKMKEKLLEISAL